MTSRTLLVVASVENWHSVFAGAVLDDGSRVRVEQCRWRDLHIEASSLPTSPLVCYLAAQEGSPMYAEQGEEREIRPDFLLFRNFPADLHGIDYRSLVVGLAYSGIHGVNSPTSVLRSLDRPIVYAELLRISERVGRDRFPLIPMKYHANSYAGTKMRMIDMAFPTVIKVGSTHAGFGKAIVKTQSEYDDLESILALKSDYFTEEPFTKHEYEFRVQVIGPHVRCFRRNSDSSWKNNWGNLRFEDHPWNPKYELWVDEVRQLFGGLDMFAFDVLHVAEGRDVILELNDYAMGLDYDFEVEDQRNIRELVILRMNEQLRRESSPTRFIGRFEQSTTKRGQARK